EAVQPGQEGSALPSIPPDRLPSFEEDLFGKVFGFRMATGSEIQVPVDPLDEAVVQLAECVGVFRDNDAIDECHDCGIIGALDGLGRLCTRYRQRVRVLECYGVYRRSVLTGFGHMCSRPRLPGR